MLLLRLSLALALVLAVREWVWEPVLIRGESMQPTLHSGQIAAVNKLAYRFGAPRRGDVVAVWTGRELMVKRILGLPGEEIGVRDGVFYVNDRPLAEPYVQCNDRRSISAGQLGPNRFIVAGDNRSETVIAVLNRERIVGRLVSLRKLLHSAPRLGERR